jgi:mono/diheme cytochrome c family protein
MRAKYWLLAIALVMTAIGIGTIRWLRRGFSARDQPSAIEKVIAHRLRSLAVPALVRDVKNPVALTPEVLADARAHFADHCASCHANDGSGNTTIGQNLYPKAPDMRLDATQRLTDGELYAIIQNGIRLTGMPAWGKEGDEHDLDSWKCVHLIRHLNELTPAQLIEMKHMNPKSPDELQEEKEEAEFLRGGEPTEERPSHGQHQH